MEAAGQQGHVLQLSGLRSSLDGSVCVAETADVHIAFGLRSNANDVLCQVYEWSVGRATAEVGVARMTVSSLDSWCMGRGMPGGIG